MTASEPLLLWALIAVPVLALLAVAAARPRNRVVAGLHLWQRVHSGTAKSRRRWLTPVELALLLAAVLAILGAVDPGWMEQASNGPPQPMAEYRPRIQTAAVDGQWLLIRTVDPAIGPLTLRSSRPWSFGRDWSLTSASRGSEFLIRLPRDHGDNWPLVVTTSDDSVLLGLWPEPPIAVENKALNPAAFAALLEALEGVTDAARPNRQSTPTLALLGPNDASELPRLIFHSTPAVKTPSERPATIAAAHGWEELAFDPDFAAAASTSGGLGEEHKYAEPLVWIRLGDENLTIAAIHRERRELIVSVDVPGMHSAAAWVPHLLALGIRELGFRDVLDPTRFRLFRAPAKDSKPVLPFETEPGIPDARFAPGIYMDAVVNLPTAEDLRGHKPTESSSESAPAMTPFGWLPLLLSAVLLLWVALGSVARTESARRAVANPAGA